MKIVRKLFVKEAYVSTCCDCKCTYKLTNEKTEDVEERKFHSLLIMVHSGANRN